MPQGKQTGSGDGFAPWLALLLLFGGIVPILVLVRYSGGFEGGLASILLLNIAYSAVFTLFMLWCSIRALTRKLPNPSHNTSPPDVTIAIPVHNEARNVLATLQSLLDQSVPPKRIVIVDDGSTDDTVARIVMAYKLKKIEPSKASQVHGGVLSCFQNKARNLWLVTMPHCGKASALNTALACCESEIFITVDADCIFVKDAIENMSRAMTNPEIVAAGGMIKVANGLATARLRHADAPMPGPLLSRLQWAEYATGFVWRFGWSWIGAQLLLSGSFSGFRANLLKMAGGFDVTSITEDYEMAYRLHKISRDKGNAYRIITVRDALCYTLVPETLGSYLRQRTRWYQGFIRTIWLYRGCILNHRYGWFGIFALPAKLVDALSPPLALAAIIGIIWAVISGAWGLLLNLAFLISIRWGLEFINSWMLLALHHKFIQPKLPQTSKLMSYLFGPLNFMFHTLCWYIYSVLAYFRVASGSRGWKKTRQQSFEQTGI